MNLQRKIAPAERDRVVSGLGITVLVLSIISFSGAQVLPRDVVLVVVVLLSVLLVAKQARIGRPQWPLLCFAAFAAISPIWADNPENATRAVVALLASTLAAGCVAISLRGPTMLRWIDRTLKGLALGSLAIALLLPAIGVEQRAGSYGAMTGLFVHKNVLGTVVVLAIATHLIRVSLKRRPIAFLFWAGILGLVVIGTQSSTTLVLTLLVVGCVALMRLSSALGKAASTAVVALTIPVLVLVGVVVLSSFEWALGLVGRDLTFSGRLKIWEGSWAAAQSHMVSGYGWGSVFAEGDDAAEIIVQYVRWYVPSAHSGLLTVLLQVGVVGVVLGILAVFAATRSSIQMYLAHTGDFACWAIVVMLILITNNIFDSRFDGVLFFLLALVSCVATQFRRAVKQTGSIVSEVPAR